MMAYLKYLQSLVTTPLLNFTTRKHVPTLAIATLCCFIASFTVPLFSIILGNVFNDFTLLGSGDITGDALLSRVSRQCLQFLALGMLAWLFNGIYYTLFVIFGELQAANARSKLFDILLKKEQRFFEEHEEGVRTFLGGLQIQVQELQTATSNSLALVLQYIFRILVSLGVSFYTSWNLTLVILAGIPFVSLIVPYLTPKINAGIQAQQNELKTASKVVNNAVSSIDTVKCLNAQDFELKKFTGGVDKAASEYTRMARLNALQITAMRFIMFAMFVQGFWYGSYLVTSGKLSAGDVLRTFWACSAFAQAIEWLMPHLMILEKGKVAAAALQRTLNDGLEATTSREMQGALYPSHCEGAIEVKKLSFAYPSQPERFSLASSSFLFPAGATTFVIGKSGSGKSTLGQLLTRFYLPTSGEILIDGYPIQTLGVNWIRNNITYVDQRSILFNESIFKNIAFGSHDHENIRERDMENSINLAMLASMVGKLPHGIDTFVGEGGNALSGGQKQRVAIARARLRDSHVLILDELTSALDGANRVHIMNSIRKWREGKTTIIITHEMSHIKDNDFVYVMDSGYVVQAGYREELKEDPKLSAFFHEDENQEDDCSVANYNDGNLSVTSSWSSDELDKPPPLPPKDSYMYNPGNIRDDLRSSLWRSDQIEASLRKDPFVSHNEIEMEDLGMRTRSVHFDGPSKTSKLRRRLKVRRPAKRSRNEKSVHQQSLQKPIRRALKSVLPNLLPRQRLFIAIAVFCILAHAAATPIFSYFLAELLKTFYNKSNNSMKWALAVLGVSIGDAFTNYYMFYLLDICGQAWVDGLRKQAFHKVLDQARKWFEDERNSASQLTICLHESGEDVRTIITRFTAFVLVAVSIMAMAVIWSLAICWKQTLVALSCGPIVFAISRGFEKTNGIWDRRCIATRASASDVFLETFSEIRTVRSLTLEPYFHLKHLKAASQCLRMGLRKAIYTGLLFGLVETSNVFVTALIFYYGATLVRYNEFTVDDITAVNSVLLFSLGYASTVMTWIPQISNSREMVRRLFRLVDLPHASSHEHEGVLQVRKAAPVQLNHLSFRYPSRPEASVLRNVSLTIPEGSCTAIVGRSGSGKSTIASLLLSLYETPSSFKSSILLAGINIRKIHTPSLRSLVCIVPQQPTIFPGTIQENISYGLDQASEQSNLLHVRTAARAAGVDQFISSLPGGYQTVIGDGGVGLSGGQAQRIVIARALVRQPQILILDEATSALDPDSATTIKTTVRRLVAAKTGLTVIIITHAKEMMEIADDIFVLEDGRIVEQGPYRALLRRSGGKLRALIAHPEPDNTEDNTI